LGANIVTALKCWYFRRC